MKQTAVQWYAERLYDLEMAYNQGVIKTNTYIKGKKEAVEKAKEMEKKRMMDAVVWFDDTDRRPYQIEESFEQYYNETYGGNNHVCCTPEGQIKRYLNCIGCDRKPQTYGGNK